MPGKLRHISNLLLAFLLVLPLVSLAAQTAPALPSTSAQSANTPSTAPAYHLPAAKLKQAEALAVSRNLLGFGGAFWGFVVLLGMLATGIVARTERWTERITSRGWLQGLLFCPVILLELELLSLPVAAISHKLNRSNGISVQHWGSWLVDVAKSTLLTLLLMTLILMLVRWLIYLSPHRYWLWFWAIWIPMQVVGIFLVPILVDPLFNKFEPLQPTHPALVAELQKVVARTGTNIPPERMYLMKASEKTNGINAYVTGIGATKRIVIWDTTADRVPTDQILFIFGHESGHYVLRHIPKFLAFLSVLLFFALWAVARLAERMVARFGSHWKLSGFQSWGGVFVLFFVFTLAQFVLEPTTNAASRFEEHEADIYGQEAMHGILPDPQRTAVAAFNTLGEAYLEAPHTNRLIEIWSYSHPAIEKRAEFAAHYNPWQPDQQPKFFPADK